MKHLFTLVLLCPIIVFSQINEEFIDGDFTNNPPWIGMTQNFIVNNDFMLQLNDEGEGISYLATANNYGSKCEWRFTIKQSFSPSSNNNSRVYLISDKSNLLEPLKGYFLQFGESGSNDAIELFRQDGEIISSICRGEDGFISSSFAIAVKVRLDEQNKWEVYADASAGENYQLLAEAIEVNSFETAFFGFYCKYTSSNSTKFYFDDIYVGDIIIDSIAPIVMDVKVISDSSLSICFNESLSQETAENTMNFFAGNNIKYPSSAKLKDDDPTSVELIFDTKFISGIENTISIKNIEDLSANKMNEMTIGFMFFVAAEFDIIINEIMADPTPIVGLPEYEYIELYNPLPHEVRLDQWKILIGSSEKEFQYISIDSASYLILAKENAHEELSEYGKFYGFSSFSLTNASQELKLISAQGKKISSVTYTDEWYKDHEKEGGGWSIEQINPKNLCSSAENWRASIDMSGGSPGSINSVNSDIILIPKLSRIELLDSKKVQLTFNQNMDSMSMATVANYMVNENVGSPASVLFSPFKPNKSVLSFTDEFVEGISYELKIHEEILNCKYDKLAHDTILKFGIAEDAVEMDILINELLFNPLGDGVDYIELYNASFKVIDLSQFSIASIRNSPPNPIDTMVYSISDGQFLFMPGEYVCLSSSPQIVKEQYYTSNPNGFIKMVPFPAMNNDEGSLILLYHNDFPIDAVEYNEDMHFPLLNYYDGVSLERSSFLMPGNDNNNWHSAAETFGFGTPAYQNSQFIDYPNLDDNIIIEPEIFSPDNDGYKDLLIINYNFDQAGYVLNVDIYDSNLFPIRKLIDNQYIGISGSFQWDGIKDDNSKASIGIYVIHIQVFDLDGNVKHIKKTAVLASKW